MKRILFSLLALVAVAALAAVAYLAVARMPAEQAASNDSAQAAATDVNEKTPAPAAAKSSSDEPATLKAANVKIAFLESRAAAYAGDSDVHRKLANALVTRAGFTGDAADYDRAWKELDRAESLSPGEERILLARALLLLARHRFGQARALAERGLQKNPDNTDLLSVAGNGAINTGDLDGAEKIFRKFTTIAPELLSSWAGLSQVAELRGDFEEAANLMRRAVKAGYEKPAEPSRIAWALTILGEIEAKRDHADLAREQYEEALAQSPDHPLALEFMADLDQWEGKLAAAEAGYRKVLSIQPEPKVRLNLATLLERMGKKEEAAQMQEESLKFYEWAVKGGNEGYLRPLATLDLAAGRFERAEKLAAHELALRPTMESRLLYASIVKAAAAAGRPVKETQISQARETNFAAQREILARIVAIKS
ncbi:MAG: tetratricopeptide repeat protein [Pyrinomonadaceae bacterium]